MISPALLHQISQWGSVFGTQNLTHKPEKPRLQKGKAAYQVGGWTNSVEKHICQNGCIFPKSSGWTKKHIWNHNLGYIGCLLGILFSWFVVIPL